MLRTKTFEIKHHLTVIELCPGRTSETVGDAQAAGPAAYEADFYRSTSGTCVRWSRVWAPGSIRHCWRNRRSSLRMPGTRSGIWVGIRDSCRASPFRSPLQNSPTVSASEQKMQFSKPLQNSQILQWLACHRFGWTFLAAKISRKSPNFCNKFPDCQQTSACEVGGIDSKS